MKYSTQAIDTRSNEIMESIGDDLFHDVDREELLERMRKYFTTGFLELDVYYHNSWARSRKWRKMEILEEELRNRGIGYGRITEKGKSTDEILVGIGSHSYHVRSDRGILIALPYPSRNGSNRPYFRCTMPEKEIVDLICFTSEVESRTEEMIRLRCIECDRNMMLSQIEFPAVEYETDRFCKANDIRYTLQNKNGKITVSAYLRNGIWINKVVTAESITGDLRIIPYLRKRPDRIGPDGRGWK